MISRRLDHNRPQAAKRLVGAGEMNHGLKQTLKSDQCATEKASQGRQLYHQELCGQDGVQPPEADSPIHLLPDPPPLTRFPSCRLREVTADGLQLIRTRKSLRQHAHIGSPRLQSLSAKAGRGTAVGARRGCAHRLVPGQLFSRDAPETIDYNAKAVKLSPQGSFLKCNDERKSLTIQLRIDAMEHGMIGGTCVIHFLISFAIERGDANLLDTVFELHFRSSTTKDAAHLVEYNGLERVGDSTAVHHTAEKSRSLSLVLGYDQFSLEQKGEYRKTREWDVDDQYRVEMTNASDHLHVRLCRPGETKHIKPPTKILVHAAVACPRGRGLDVAAKVLVKKPENIEAAGEWKKVDLDKLRPSNTDSPKLTEDVPGVESAAGVEKENLEKYRTIMHILDRTLGSKDPTTEWCAEILAKSIRDEVDAEEERREELEERKRADDKRREEARKRAKETSANTAKDDK